MPTVDYPIPPDRFYASGSWRSPIVGNDRQGSCAVADGRGEMLWFAYDTGAIRCFATTAGAMSILHGDGTVGLRSTVPHPPLTDAGAQCGVTRAPDGRLFLSVIGTRSDRPFETALYWTIWVDSSLLSDGSGPWVHYSTVKEDEEGTHVGFVNEQGNRANAGEIVMDGSTWFAAGHDMRPTFGTWVWREVGMVSHDSGLSWSMAVNSSGSISYPRYAVPRQFGKYRGQWWWTAAGSAAPSIYTSSDLTTWAPASVSGLGNVGDGMCVPISAAGHAFAEVSDHIISGTARVYRALVGYYHGEPLAAPAFAAETIAGNYGTPVWGTNVSVWGPRRWWWYVDMSGTGVGPWAVTNSAGEIRGISKSGGWMVGEHRIRIG